LQRSEAAIPQKLDKVPRRKARAPNGRAEIFTACTKNRSPARSFMQMRA
jgi:hypothetical protein